MKNKSLNTLLLLLSLNAVFSCRFGPYIQTPNSKFATLINDKRVISNNKINFNGVYHKIEKEDYHNATDYKNGVATRYVDTPFLDNPIYFFNNGVIGFRNTLSLDSITFVKNLEKYSTQKDSYTYDWGVYEITNDTIKAVLYIAYDGSIFKGMTQVLQSNFQGYISSKDTIFGWHLVPPYPPIVKSPNELYFKFLTTPRDLYFKKIPIEELVDPEKVWINKYRKNE
jgi:hypothetical protein